MTLYVDNYNETQKYEQEKSLYTGYQIASLTASFVNMSMSGKKLPDFYDIYPSLKKVSDEDKKIALYKEQFLFFAEQHNAKRKGAK